MTRLPKFLALATMVAGMATNALAAVKELNAAEFTLNGKVGYYEPALKKLDGVLTKVTVSDVLASANHPTKAYSGDFNTQFTWDKQSGYDDQNTKSWYPQGLTTSSDAYDKGTVEGKDVILASWYSKGSSKGVRISFIDVAGKKYRNVLLVVPEEEGPSFHSVKIHAGGIMWYGDKLYVVDTANGIRIFDTSRIYEVDVGDGIGKVGSKYQAYNYKYVIPQWGHYLPGSKVADSFKYSFISLDRTTTPDSIVMGQYNETGANNRVVRFDIDASTRTLKHTTGTTAVATKFYYFGVEKMQGAASITVNGKSKYFFSCSRTAANRGALVTWTEGSTADPREYSGVMSTGPEDFSYRKQTGELWTLGEHPGNRPVYGIKASDY
ncbi:hypothetical protein BDA99DRAFT_294794 [Phascolomyces articulosus]|uniref:Secreted protein n=1 Tax=Phascolomyces articulosus TaxID=60185 RepID=A0AAD5JLA5_9FUNG|nr:hypothetical protein BDA99DRAFT_294794 [Phascolomyces articulosus]